MREKGSFWSTVPGILTGIAAIITAVGGFLLVLSQSGFLVDKEPREVSEPDVAGPKISDSDEALNETDSKKLISSGRKEPESPAKDSRAPIVTRVNLLAPENGGQVLAATSDQWLKTIDGEGHNFAFYESNLGGKTEAVFAFRDERPAEFDTFTVLVLDTRDGNLKDFELLWGNDSPTGMFHSLGKFQTQNMKLFKTPYQEFKFPPVTAKYLKVRLFSTWKYALINAREFQLRGSLR